MRKKQLTRPSIWRPVEGQILRGYVRGKTKADIGGQKRSFWEFVTEDGVAVLLPEYYALNVLQDVKPDQLVEIHVGQFRQLRGGRSFWQLDVFLIEDEEQEEE